MKMICKNCEKKQMRGQLFKDTKNRRCCTEPFLENLPDTDGGQVEAEVIPAGGNMKEALELLSDCKNILTNEKLDVRYQYHISKITKFLFNKSQQV